MHRLSRPIGLMALGLLFACAARAQEWTRFRGPNGDGLSDSVFPAKITDKDWAWKIDLPGGGHSSPVLWGDKLFLTCGDDSTGRQTVLCLNAADGKQIWRRDYDARTFSKHLNNSYASSTPAVDADRVYLCWSTPEELTLFALDHGGTELWRAHLGVWVSQHGGGQSPSIAGDIILLPGVQEGEHSFIFGIDKKSGRVVWQTPMAKTDKFCPATPCLYQPKDGPQQAIFLSKVEAMSGVDPLTGKILWQSPGVFDARAVASPVIWHDIIFGSCGDGPKGHQLAAVHAGAEGKPAKKAWLTETDTPYVTTMLLKHDLLFCWGDNGIVTCRQPETGKIVWQSRVPGAAYFGSPVCAGETIYAVSQAGDLVSIAAKDSFQLLGRTPLGEKCEATPAIAGGRMFVRTYSHLYCVAGKGN